MNELAFIIILLIISGTIITTYHFLEKLGLKILLIIMTILFFIMSFKNSNFLGININLNLIPSISIYTIMYVIIEKYNQKDLKEYIKLIITTILYTIPIYIIFTLFTQSINDSIILNINHIINIIPSIITLLLLPVFILFTLNLYKYLKEINKNFYINVIICTIITTLIESIIHGIILNILNFNLRYIIQLALGSYLLKIIIILINISIIKLIISRRKWLS